MIMTLENSESKFFLEIWRYFYHYFPDVIEIETPFWPRYRRDEVASLVKGKKRVNWDIIPPRHRLYFRQAILKLRIGDQGDSEFSFPEVVYYDLLTRLAYEQYAIVYQNDTQNISLDYWMRRFARYLSGHGVVVDVGCGPGRDLERLRFYSKQVIGIDIARAMLRIAQKRGAMLVQMDMRALGLASNSVEGIWCVASLLHLRREEVVDVLEGFWRILQPKGVLFVSVKQGTGMQIVYRKKTGRLPRLFTYFSKQEISAYLQKVGFQVLEISRNLLYRENIGWSVWINSVARKPYK